MKRTLGEALWVSTIDSTDPERTLRGTRRSLNRTNPLNVHERRLLLSTLDGASASLGLGAAILIMRPANLPWVWPLALIISWILALVMVDGYALRIPSNRQLSVIAVLKATPILFALSAILYLLTAPTSRAVLLVAVAIESVAVMASRLTVARLLLHESLARRTVLLGEDFEGDVQESLAAAHFEQRIVAHVSSELLSTRGESALASLRRLCEDEDVDEVIISAGELQIAPELVEACMNAGVRVVPSSRLSEEYLGRVAIRDVDASWYLSLPIDDLWERPYSMVRRSMDVLCALSLSIPFLLALPVVALVIKLESPGPVFLVQRRVGLLGHQFDLLKLRTMRIDAEAVGGAQLAMRRDKRVTRIGVILRRTRIDEIPQVFNILRGEMSFIGPRPERPELSEVFEAKIPHFRARLMVKPGLTGWAQVKGGYAGSLDEMRRKLEYDLYYIKHRSLRLDLQILASTFGVVAGLKGF